MVEDEAELLIGWDTDGVVDVLPTELVTVLVIRVLRLEEDTNEAELRPVESVVIVAEEDEIDIGVVDIRVVEVVIIEEEDKAMRRAPSTPLVTGVPTRDFV